MATDVRRPQDEHWTAKGAVMAVALAAGVLLPLVGLTLIVPCLVAARRAGTTTKPYLFALGINVLWLAAAVLSYAAQSLIEPR
jgi:uncharacterized iron-regulated membrane protein